ncbi:MAG: hypothetical protein ACHQEM_11055, partial [Chitinophagales bacterium]
HFLWSAINCLKSSVMLVKRLLVLSALFYSANCMYSQPGPRVTGVFCYYPPMHALLLFDGYTIHPEDGSDPVWSWDGKKWKSVQLSGAPSKSLSSGDYDPDKQVVTLFGGIGKGHYDDLHGDAWSFDGLRWARSDSEQIGTRDHHKMVYANHLKSFVMYGGSNTNRSFDSSTWIFKEGRWRKLNIPGPGSRFHFGMTYDPLRQRVVLYGGYSASGIREDTWEFDGSYWKKIETTGPGPRGRSVMLYDPELKQVILYGGDAGKIKVDKSVNPEGEIWDVRGDTWAWDGTKWTKIAEGGPGRMLPALGFDPERKVLVLYGGGGASTEDYADTWEFQNSHWERIINGGIWKWDDNKKMLMRIE